MIGMYPHLDHSHRLHSTITMTVPHHSRVAIRPEVLFTQYISYFSDDVMKVEFESWNESAKSVRAATKSN